MLTYAVLMVALADIPPDIEAYLKASDANRAEAASRADAKTKELTAEITRGEALMAKAEKGEINKLAKVTGYNENSKRYIFRSVAERQKAVATAQSDLNKIRTERIKSEQLAEKIKGRTYFMMISVPKSKFGSLGPYRVTQVVDDLQMIVSNRLTKELFWVVGPTNGIVDDQEFTDFETVYQHDGTKTYPTADNGSNTIHKLRKIDIKPHLEEWEKRKKN